MRWYVLSLRVKEMLNWFAESLTELVCVCVCVISFTGKGRLGYVIRQVSEY